jgi:hypothetical protein
MEVHPGLLSAGLNGVRHHPTSNRKTPGDQLPM